MSRLAKEISTTGVATFVVALVLFGLAQLIGSAFTTQQVVASEQSESGHGAASETQVASNNVATDADFSAGVTLAAAQGDPVPTGKTYALGREATDEEVAAWNIDVRPDGQGLPAGSGDVFTGEEIFAEQCAVCHGDFGEGVDRWPVLAGGQDTLTADRPVKTIGSYWPYLSTVFDYVNRAMPFGNAQSLTPDEVYAITAYLLYVNDLVDDDFELSNETFTGVKLPNEPNFFPDDRAEVEYPKFTKTEVCMTDCKDAVEITARAAVVDVTPEETKARKLREAVQSVQDTGSAAAQEVAQTDTTEAASTTETATMETAAAATAAPDPELVKVGAKVFKKCKACHMIGEGAKKKSGPILTDVVGRPIGSMDGFNYSKAMAAAGAEGRVWSPEELRGFLANPRGHMKGTKMSFKGLKKDKDLDGIIAYLQANGG